MKLVVSLLAMLMAVTAYAEVPSSFSRAKKIAATIYVDLYANEPETFYCGCHYQGKVVNAQGCGYQPRKQAKRGKRVEWEHVVPAWEVGHQRQCWQNGGRKNCKRTDPEFVTMTSDLHNLVPAVGELNGDRSNYRFGMLEGEPRAYGACDFEVDFKLRRAEPAPDRQGDVARIYFYMRDTYGLKISRQQTQLFEAWSRMDPVDQRELLRDQSIQHAQGNSNCYVSGC